MGQAVANTRCASGAKAVPGGNPLADLPGFLRDSEDTVHETLRHEVVRIVGGVEKPFLRKSKARNLRLSLKHEVMNLLDAPQINALRAHR